MNNEINKIIGQSVEDVLIYLKKLDYTIRIVEEDGRVFMVTMDFKNNRVNVIVENGLIISIQGLG